MIQRFLLPGSVAVLLVLGWLAYSPGLSSLLLYDDFPNLSALGVIAGEPLFSGSFWQFVLNGDAGPLGRPLPLFTFALQAAAWPDDPFAFKAVNVLIHIGNGALVVLIARELARAVRLDASPALYFTMFTAAFWLLHPIHNATVLFTVQRMTLLASSFMLLGIWLHLRIRLATGMGEQGRFLRLTLTLGICGLLSTLSKELAPVFLCYLLALEYTVLATIPTSPAVVVWRRLCLWLPLGLLLIGLVLYWDVFQAMYVERREFNAGERLMTEARVLWSYLRTLAAPSISSLALFQQPEVSVALLQPMSTLPAVVAWIAALVAALVWRQRYPWIAFAVFWYLGGHLVESTVIPLELQFNHRNYLAALGPLVAVAYGFAKLPAVLPRFRSLSTLFAGALAALLFLQTFNQSRLWSDPLTLASTWYAANPRDGRSAEFLAVQLAEQGPQQAAQAAALFEQLAADQPGRHRFLMTRWLLGCRYPAFAPVEPTLVAAALQADVVPGNDLIGPLTQLVSLAANGNCAIPGTSTLTAFAERNHAASSGATKGQIAFQIGRLAWLQERDGGPATAEAHFTEAYSLTLDPGILFTHAQYLLSLGRGQDALRVLDQAERRLREHNDIATGTREQKLAALESLRSYARQ